MASQLCPIFALPTPDSHRPFSQQLPDIGRDSAAPADAVEQPLDVGDIHSVAIRRHRGITRSALKGTLCHGDREAVQSADTKYDYDLYCQYTVVDKFVYASVNEKT